MGETKIEWAKLGLESGFSVNPFRARDIQSGAQGHFCQKISPGCAHCYASRLQSRFKMPPYTVENRAKIEFYFERKALRQVTSRRKPTGFFWFDMTDCFLGDYPWDWIKECYDVVKTTPRHRHAWLTKRPERMRDFFGSFLRTGNLWPGFSAENQETFDARWAAIKPLAEAGWLVWASLEPLLGKIVLPDDFLRLARWTVTGGESGPRARPSHPDWFRSVRDQCQAAGVPYFHKQNGEWLHERQCGIKMTMISGKLTLVGIEGMSMDVCKHTRLHEWPDGSYSLRVGRKRAGRLLNGREWNEFPNKPGPDSSGPGS